MLKDAPTLSWGNFQITLKEVSAHFEKILLQASENLQFREQVPSGLSELSKNSKNSLMLQQKLFTQVAHNDWVIYQENVRILKGC